ncbi:MAG: hypothetical protein ACHQ1H_06050 [Nitrososphaerales archaeon]
MRIDTRTDRPMLVSVIGYLEVLLGFVGLIWAAVTFFSLWIAGFGAGGFFYGAAVGGFVLLVALVTIAVGYGLLAGANWAWTVAVGISVIDAIVGLIQIFGGNISTLRLGVIGVGGFTGVGTLVISGLVLFYLFRPNVRRFFED